jgi:hypothetical protein
MLGDGRHKMLKTNAKYKTSKKLSKLEFSL